MILSRKAEVTFLSAEARVQALYAQTGNATPAYREEAFKQFSSCV